jgi:DNA-binding GntR family transcriptional regulator
MVIEGRPPSPGEGNVADYVYATLTERLVDREVQAGTRLSIDRLALALGVSPTPVREALTRLEPDGLVARLPNRGYEVAPALTSRIYNNSSM